MLFKERFMPYVDELRRRCIFIENEAGEKVATATAWWSFVFGERRPWIHWVGADPRYQGLGLGKAIISRATELLIELEGDVPLFLKTQTWSYKAIDIYKACGFEPTEEKTLYKDRKDNYRKALRILSRIPR
jgi:GNAT superfamily N-acetyltransferase